MDKDIFIDNPELIHRLLMSLSEDRCEFSAILKPNIPEFIDISGLDYSAIKGKYPKFDETLEKLKEKLKRAYTYNRAKALYLHQFGDENGVMPFSEMKFNGSWGLDVEILFNINCFQDDNMNNLLREYKLDDANAIASGKKFGTLYFDSVERRCTGKAKEAINNFVKEGYCVTYLHAELDPNDSTSDHYYTRHENKGSFRAQYGKNLIVDGLEINIDDLPTSSPTKPRKPFNLDRILSSDIGSRLLADKKRQ